MRHVVTRAPSFPGVAPDTLLEALPDQVWQVVCGDGGHWRAGIYSPSASAREHLQELERHDCPELFLLMRGRVILVVSDEGRVREIELQQGKPMLISAPHTGYCPDGPHTGAAFVVERDCFDTEYRGVAEW